MAAAAAGASLSSSYSPSWLSLCSWSRSGYAAAPLNALALQATGPADVTVTRVILEAEKLRCRYSWADSPAVIGRSQRVLRPEQAGTAGRKVKMQSVCGTTWWVQGGWRGEETAGRESAACRMLNISIFLGGRDEICFNEQMVSRIC